MEKFFALIFLFFFLSGCTQTEQKEETIVEKEIQPEKEQIQPQQAEQKVEIKTETIVTGFSGRVLAGSTAPLVAFTQQDFEKAIATDKLVVLYFYANWCPICKEEIPHLEGAFNELSTEKVIGFRVNYNDSETDENERNLAREFGVAYQHTKVFLKNGERILKSPESWEKQRYLEEINKYSG